MTREETAYNDIRQALMTLANLPDYSPEDAAVRLARDVMSDELVEEIRALEWCGDHFGRSK